MVFRMNDAGTGGWHEPPYTWEEEQELYRRMSPQPGVPTTIYRDPRPAAASKQRPEPKDSDSAER